MSIESEFAHLDLGDKRLERRACLVLDRWSAKPGASFPKMVASDAELQGLYALVEHEHVSHRALLDAHAFATFARIDERKLSTVLVVHDTTTFSFGGESERKDLGWISYKTQGFHGHFALALSADGARTPLGVIGFSTVMRPRPAPPKTPKIEVTSRQRAADSARESLRWGRLALEAAESLRGHAVPIHVMDSEGDAYVTLGTLERHAQRFVVRAAELARVVRSGEDGFVEKGALRYFAERSVPITAREVQLTRRRASPFPKARKEHPPRPARPAKLEMAAQRIRMPRPSYVLEDLPDAIDVNIVHVRELETPDGMEPVEWILLTTEPVDTEEDVLRVVDHYRARWTIEEYFKAVKTGCAYESRQLEGGPLLVALALCVPVAWQMLALRHQSRTEPDAPADTVMSAPRLRALRIIARKPLPSAPTVKDVFYAIAALGGHIERNGPPGWITLRAGFDELLIVERAFEAAKSIERCDQ